MLPRIFKGYNVKLDQADNGLTLVRLASENQYDGLITDNNMEGGDGVDALEQIRSLGINTPALFTSGRVDQDLRDRVMRISNVYMLNKPFDLLDLSNKIKEVWPKYFQN